MTITTGNTAPVAVAGPDSAGLFAGSVAALDGTGSADADGHALSYRWSLLSVPAGSAALLSDAMAPSPWFAIDRVGQYVAQLIVNDGFQDSAPDTVVVTAENRAPSADAGSDQSVFLGAVATLSGAASNNPDGDALTYEWSFTAVPAGSAATLGGASSVAPSFTPDVVGDYTLSVTVSDGAGATASDSVVVQRLHAGDGHGDGGRRQRVGDGARRRVVHLHPDRIDGGPLVVRSSAGGSADRRLRLHGAEWIGDDRRGPGLGHRGRRAGQRY